jgi:hypothetical protein
MEFRKPYIRRSQSNDQHSNSGGSQEGDGRRAKGRGSNEEGSSGWNHRLDQRFMHGTNGNSRPADEDWFEGRMAQHTRIISPKGPTRKAGWNQWVSPNLRDPKSTSAAPTTDTGKHCPSLMPAYRIQGIHNMYQVIEAGFSQHLLLLRTTSEHGYPPFILIEGALPKPNLSMAEGN